MTISGLVYNADLQLSNISPFDLERYKKTRRGEKASAGSINRELAVISHILTKAIEWNWIEKRPKVEKLDEGKGRIVFLTVDQVKRLLDAAWKHSPHVYLFCMIGIDTGMRRTEILSIQKQHIDLEKRIIYIPKAKAGARVQPITNRLAEYLKQWLAVVKDSSAYLFPYKDSHQMDNRKSFRKVVELAGLDPDEVTPHTLRHTAVSHMVQDGIDLPTVMRVSGHKTLTMVQRYAHQDDPHIMAAMDRLEGRYTGQENDG